MCLAVVDRTAMLGIVLWRMLKIWRRGGGMCLIHFDGPGLLYIKRRFRDISLV